MLPKNLALVECLTPTGQGSNTLANILADMARVPRLQSL